MVITYYNRHRDEIKFERIDDNTITMTGGKWMRFGYPNKYDKAYNAYLKKLKTLDEPDYDLLFTDIKENTILSRAYTEEEFEKAMQGNLHDYEDKKVIPALKELWKHVYSDTSTYDMVDPSGGPYLCIGMDLGKMVGFSEGFKIKWIGYSGNEENTVVTFKNVK